MPVSYAMAKYVGIGNPDSICYLNSAIQQLFMMPSFRESILALPARTTLKDPHYSESYPSFVNELQCLFEALERGRKRDIPRDHAGAVNPLHFCATMRNNANCCDGEDSESTDMLDPSKQMDVSEFMSLFFCQLSSSLGASHSLLHSGQSICGDIYNELSIANDEAVDRKVGEIVPCTEQYYFLSVKVGKSGAPPRTPSKTSSAQLITERFIGNLKEALDDFTSEQCVDAMWPCASAEGSAGRGPGQLLRSKSCSTLSASSLPPHLIIHLKRFRFDFAKMSQKKVNSRFEYPLHMDVWSNTYEARVEERKNTIWERNMREGSVDDLDYPADPPLKGRCKYALGGVIVHAGSATDGHYFSLVKERVGERQTGCSSGSNGDGNTAPDEGGSNPSHSRWFKMNDEHVSEFDLNDLERETFGGPVTGPISVKKQSAFILIYDKIS